MILPKKEVIEKALIKDYQSLYDHSIDHLEEFWQQIASELFWFRSWEKVVDWQYPYARWFIGAETNLVYNALDRWQKTEIANKLALIWVGQPEDKNSADFSVRTFTYKQLNVEVCRLANGLKSLGVKKGDRVIIYLPRIPEQFISMLACAKIGALHSVVYSGFSTDALKNRIEDAQAKIVITTNFYPYKDKILTPVKNVREAIKDFSFVEKVIVIKRQPKNSYYDLNNLLANEIFYDDLIAKQDTICSTAILNSNDPSFILYTSGSTGKPKGVVHSHGGYMVGVYATMKYVFDIKGDEIFWSTADAGWITGHSYILYGPLLNGITTFVYEGTPDYPDIEVWWRLIDRFKITHFYTAPTAIRALMRYGEEPIKKYSFSSLRILGSVGEPINPEAWLWFYKNIGREKIPIMDTWWQTETGMHILTPLPSTPLKPGSCNKPFFGVIADVVDENGNSVGPNKQGYLVLKTPWPSMLLDLWNNPKKYKQTYFEKFTNSKLQTTNEST
ncbi:MAG: AMP-binding protein, partial [Microgenomates group bacterium]